MAKCQSKTDFKMLEATRMQVSKWKDIALRAQKETQEALFFSVKLHDLMNEKIFGTAGRDI